MEKSELLFHWELFEGEWMEKAADVLEQMPAGV